MTRAHPQPGCHDFAFAAALALSNAAQVALEDYARALFLAPSAEAQVDAAGRVSGVHACGLPAPPTPATRDDLEAFAQDLAQRDDGGGLGWS